VSESTSLNITVSKRASIVAAASAIAFFALWLWFIQFYNGSEERKLLRSLATALVQHEDDIRLMNVTDFDWNRVCWRTVASSIDLGMSQERVEEWLEIKLPHKSAVPGYLYKDGVSHIPRTVLILIFMQDNRIKKSLFFRNPKVSFIVMENRQIPLVGNDYFAVAPDWYVQWRPIKEKLHEQFHERDEYACSTKERALVTIQEDKRGNSYFVIGKEN